MNAHAPSDTAKLLSRARTHAHCLWQNENLDETEFNENMVAFCIELAGGDKLKGALIASAAMT